MKKSHIQSFMVFTLGVSLLSLCMVMFSQPLSAQTTYGTISGSVTDSSGAAIVGAQVTLTNLGTSEKRAQSTGADGLYAFPDLFPGRYKIDAEKAGFKHVTRAEVVVEVQQTPRTDLLSHVGELTHVVEFTAEPTLLTPR